MSVKDFQIIAKLGEGAYSSVYKVKRIADQVEYALKKVKLQNLSDKEKQNALNEIRILASVKSQNIVQYKEAFIDETSQSLWQITQLLINFLPSIIMEFVNNGDLYQRIVEYQKKGVLFPEQDIWSIFIQVTKGLKALHDLKIFHRDLKSANVFLNKDGTVKLGDMNVSKVAKKGLLYTQTGTPYYASPEVWKDQPYDQKSDIWSLGCVLYEMTTLKPPFRAEDMEGLYKKVIKGYYPKIALIYTTDLNNVIRALLQVSPHLRPTCDKILSLPSVLQRIDDRLLLEVDESSLMLQTIRISKNLHYLTERLPKANYTPLKLKKLDKGKFIQTLGIASEDVNEASEPNLSEVGKLPRINKRSVSPPHLIEKKQNEQQIENELDRRNRNASKHDRYEEFLQAKAKYSAVGSSVDNPKDKSILVNQIYGGGKKKKRSDGKQLRQKQGAILLDIEGESKPLQLKSRKNQQSSGNIKEENEQQVNEQRYESRLPIIQRQGLPLISQKSNKQIINKQLLEEVYQRQKDQIVEERLNKQLKRPEKKHREISQSNSNGNSLLPDIKHGKHNQYQEDE